MYGKLENLLHSLTLKKNIQYRYLHYERSAI